MMSHNLNIDEHLLSKKRWITVDNQSICFSDWLYVCVYIRITNS